MTTDIQASLGAIRKLVKARTVEFREPPSLSAECICHWNPENGYRIDIVCPRHDGVVGWRPDPRYELLRKIVCEPCPCTQVEDLRASYLPYEDHPTTCKPCYLKGHHTDGCVCKGTSYTPRSWDGQPEGALAGALLRWALYWADIRLLSRRLVDAFYLPDCDTAAAQVVREWLEKEKP